MEEVSALRPTLALTLHFYDDITNLVNRLNLLRRGVILANKPGLYEMSMPDDDQHTLKLFKVKRDDMGEMTFVASNKHGNDSCTFSVDMAGRKSLRRPNQLTCCPANLPNHRFHVCPQLRQHLKLSWKTWMCVLGKALASL